MNTKITQRDLFVQITFQKMINQPKNDTPEEISNSVGKIISGLFTPYINGFDKIPAKDKPDVIKNLEILGKAVAMKKINEGVKREEIVDASIREVNRILTCEK